MKFAFTLLLAFFTTVSIAQVPQKGLLFHFPFNGNIFDVSPNLLHPNLVTTNTGGIVLASDRNYNPSHCYNFTGGYLDLGMDEKLAVKDSSFTFVAWALLSSYQGVSTIFSNNFGFFWGLSVGMRNGSVYAAVSGGSMPNSISVNVPYDDNIKWNEWQHVAVVLNRSTNKFYIYVNGVKRPIANDTNYGPYGGTITGNELDFTGLPLNMTTLNGNVIGAYLAGGRVYQNFVGHLDDIALYNRALTENEITGIFSGTTALHKNSSNFSRQIYQNAVDGTIGIQGISKNAELTVFDLKGVKVASSMTSSMNVSTLPKGLYILKVTDGTTSFSEKFNKQ